MRLLTLPRPLLREGDPGRFRTWSSPALACRVVGMVWGPSAPPWCPVSDRQGLLTSLLVLSTELAHEGAYNARELRVWPCRRGFGG